MRTTENTTGHERHKMQTPCSPAFVLVSAPSRNRRAVHVPGEHRRPFAAVSRTYKDKPRQGTRPSAVELLHHDTWSAARLSWSRTTFRVPVAVRLRRFAAIQRKLGNYESGRNG